ncbi:MAG: YqgE/AlgH family protein [Planctomycetota bacterium]|jgi:putative transcriptional regulator
MHGWPHHDRHQTTAKAELGLNAVAAYNDDMSRAHAGMLLIASPILVDPNFMRSVVYLIEHDEDGCLGLIINRPLDLTLGQVWEDCPPALNDLAACAEGGPVERAKGLLIHGHTDLTGCHPLAPGLAIGGDDQALTAHCSARRLDNGPRLFLGHAGWDPSQLDDEIINGSWIVRHGHPRLLLDTNPASDLWQELVHAGDAPPPPSLN